MISCLPIPIHHFPTRFPGALTLAQLLDLCTIITTDHVTLQMRLTGVADECATCDAHARTVTARRTCTMTTTMTTKSAATYATPT
jgi:hypothetical protein